MDSSMILFVVGVVLVVTVPLVAVLMMGIRYRKKTDPNYDWTKVLSLNPKDLIESIRRIRIK